MHSWSGISAAFSVKALDYAPSRTVHEGCYSGDFVIGDGPIGRTARFEDATWYPPGR
ncbi:MAG TPA: hypothetical protein VGQ68_01440 [Gaiellaceae bacterium]|jgi:hypothetical protein|nr:hypothetical protein [Gaiellaceae bacterium]